MTALGPGSDQVARNSKTWPPFGTAQLVSGHPFLELEGRDYQQEMKSDSQLGVEGWGQQESSQLAG